MSVSGSSPHKNYYILLNGLLTLLAFMALFVFRAVDNNRLASWESTFKGIDLRVILLILALGVIIAFVLSRFSFPERGRNILLFALSFIACMSFWQEPEVIVDVSRYFTQAKHLSTYGIKFFLEEWGRGINAWTDMPLVPFFYGLIFKFFGESRIYIQIFTTAMFSMTVVLTCMTGEMLWDRDTGIYAGAMLLGIPYIFTQVPIMLSDVPSMFFLTLLIYAFIRAMEKGGAKNAVFASAALVMVFFSKYSLWLMFSVLIVIVAVYLIQTTPPQIRTESKRGGRQTTTDRKSIITSTALIILIAGILIGTAVLFKFDVISEQIELLLSYQRPGLKRWGESFISTFFFQIHPFVTISAIGSLFLAFRKRDLKYMIICWLVLLVLFLQIRRIRYIMIVFPMVALMASYGLQAVKTREIRRFIAICIVTVSLVTSIFVYLPFLQKMSPANLKQAGKYLNSIDTENIEVFTLPSERNIINSAVSVPILDFFTYKDLYYSYDDRLPAFEKIRKSSLRFTWEYKNPGYYSRGKKNMEGNRVIVVISSERGQKIPERIAEKTDGFYLSRVFDANTRFFKYVTKVWIYEQNSGS